MFDVLRMGSAALLVLLFSAPAARSSEPEESRATATATATGVGSDDELSPLAVPAPSAQALEYHRTGNWLWAIGLAWAFGVQAFMLFSGLSAWLRDAARRIGRVWFFTVALYWIFYSFVVFVLELPLAYYAGFVRQHEYGLSNQTLGRWLDHTLKGLGVELAAGFLFLWVPYLLLARSPKRWWLHVTLVSVPFSFFAMLIAPIWIDPLFNDFGPMKDPVLERKILALAERAGITGSHIYEVDKSADTKALNAYVKGFLDTKRIVLYDTLLAQLDDREVLAVMGHEMGHYALGHVTRTILLSPLIVLAVLFLADLVGRRLVARHARRFGFDRLSDVASVPLLVLLLQVNTLLLTPLIMAYSRAQEHEADRFALELTRTNRSAARAFAKLQQENLGVPYHTTIEKFLRATHPSIGERIEYCNQYHPWTEGSPSIYEAYFRQ